MENREDTTKKNEYFELFTYTVEDSLNDEFLYHLESIALKYVRNLRNKKFSLNGEEAYVETDENSVYFLGLCFNFLKKPKNNFFFNC
jgi:hypothetical protein